MIEYVTVALGVARLGRTPPIEPAPMPHHKLKKHWRVPMWTEDGSYNVCVDEDYIRRFTDETLPIFIKMKIPFMKSSYVYSPEEDLVYWDMDSYIPPKHSKALENIGWQYSKDGYMLVLHEKDLDSLKGERQTKETNNDTRSKGKKQSKENLGFTRLLSFLPSNWRLWKKWYP